MSLGATTRQSAEARAADQINTILQALFNIDQLRRRIAGELAAGTLELPEWYGGDTADKSNFVGALDQMGALYRWIEDEAHPSPGVAAGADPLSYARFLTGNA